MNPFARRALALLSVAVLAPVLTACGGSAAVSNAASAVQSLASKASSAAASAEASSPAASPTEDSSSPVAAAGAASDYCGAFTEMQSVTKKQPSVAVAAATFRQAAADMKKYAPAEIADSANAYADVVAKVADSIETRQAKATSTLMKELSANPTMIAEVSAYVAKNCTG